MRSAIPYALGFVGAVGGFFLMEWLQDVAPVAAGVLFWAVMALTAWMFWPWRNRSKPHAARATMDRKTGPGMNQEPSPTRPSGRDQ
jgi:hypothetical protein